MVHFPDAPLTNGAVVGSLRLNRAALGTLEEDLSLAQVQRLDHLLGGISLGDGALDRRWKEDVSEYRG